MAAPSLNPNTRHTVTQSSGGVIWEVPGSTGQIGRVYIGSLEGSHHGIDKNNMLMPLTLDAR